MSDSHSRPVVNSPADGAEARDRDMRLHGQRTQTPRAEDKTGASSESAAGAVIATGTERFNVPGVLRMLEAEAAAAFTGERTKIELVARLIRQQQGEIEQLGAAVQRPPAPEPQTQDLVRRLRDWVHRSTAECGVDAYEAADEIERLRAALERIVRIVDDDGDPDCLEHKIARAALAVNRLEPTHADQS